ncbi:MULTISPECIES: cupin domain-containing protein [unclassified Agarivorans]|uniref:cupin domain-containing protein n=1 Tax=unclassified Agarivorans TaxID=2636026 RepID=UPI0026E23349|nr:MULTISPECIES: cupin domain-containing protein [unclassified Agarivorans]MDO6684958.1 cupin domain-containing protein [Agarivorans sp. 3_MG-2023]MDO6714881.1 cupin domain-containing protein [Agarivorans sp. 2_MG-2023]
MQYQVAFNIEDFMANYWQQQPCLLKQGMQAFIDPLTAEELAGLAMEPEIQSRLVTSRGQQWQAELGPFENFDLLGDSHSSLLVQGVDHWHPEVAKLAEAFQFIPNWRFDDVMVSYSTPEGGVGPHIDQYCVFIIQGEGKRHWRVGKKQMLKEFAPHAKLKHCEAFDAEIDVILEPGDVLYIPPGCPHEGYAVEPAINYSIGFRAPNAKDLLSGFADYLLRHDLSSKRFADPKRSATQEFGRIAENDSLALNKLMLGLLNSPEATAQFLGEHLSENAHSSDLVALSGSEDELSYSELHACMEQGIALTRCAGIKALYLDVTPYQIFVDGQAYAIPNCSWALAKTMCDKSVVDSYSLRAFDEDSKQLDWLIDLVNAGYWYFDGQCDE